VTWLRDLRPERPENAVGAGAFWYEPEVWELPLSPAARVLYAALCSFLGHGEINRQDLRGALKGSSDEEIAAALEELVQHSLLEPTPDGYAVRSVREFVP
jgi:hypothetical protein